MTRTLFRAHVRAHSLATVMASVPSSARGCCAWSRPPVRRRCAAPRQRLIRE